MNNAELVTYILPEGVLPEELETEEGYCDIVKNKSTLFCSMLLSYDSTTYNELTFNTDSTNWLDSIFNW